MIIKKGQVIFCPSCGMDLYHVNVDLYPGMDFDAMYMDPLDGLRQPRNGELARCPYCGKCYMGNPHSPTFHVRDVLPGTYQNREIH